MFSRTFKRFVLLLLTLGIFITPIQSASAESASSSKNSSLFSDVETTHWSFKNITKMNIRGVVKGYNDGSFGPERPVTQLEAVLMAVQNMRPDSLIEVEDNGDPLPVNVPDWAKNGCRQEILFAIEHGLIIPSENNFIATAPATRAWITQLMIRMTGKTDEVAGLAGDPIPITDSTTVPGWAQPYVNLALRYNLVTGYPDKSFKPNNNVTRAEMVSVLSRSEMFLDLGDSVVRGKIAGISGDSLFLMVNGNLKFYSFTPDTCFLGEDGKSSTVNDLETNNSVLIVTNNSSVRYIENISSKAVLTSRRGTILKVLPDERVLVLKDEENNVFTGVAPQTAYINSQTGEFDSLDDITPGIAVEIGINADNQIMSVMVRNAKNTAGNYVIYETNPTTNLIIFRDSADEFKSFNYSDQVIIKVPGQRFAGINDLQPGDQVSLKFSGNLITEIELVTATQDGLISGKIVLISTDKNFLTIRKDDGLLETFELSADVRLIIEGLANPDLSDLINNDSVDLSISGDSVKSITVKNRSFKSKISGSVVAVDSTNRIITISDENYQLNAYEVSRSADIIINDRDRSFSDIKTGMKITAQLENNKIIYLADNNTVEGTISAVDTDRHKITVKTNNVLQTYTFSTNVDINIYDKTNTDIDDVKYQDVAELVIENEVVTAINIRKVYSSKVVKVSPGLNEITILDEEEVRKTFDVDNRVIFTVSGITSPDLNDISVDDDIAVTFFGNRLVKIDVIE